MYFKYSRQDSMGERTARSLSHWIFSPPLYIYIIKSFLFFLFLYILFYVRNDIIHRAGQQRITGVNQSEVLVRLWQRVIPVHRFGSCVSIPIILWMEGVNSSSRNSTTHLQYLVAKGIGFGALHVLAGPDHRKIESISYRFPLNCLKSRHLSQCLLSPP